MEFNPEEKLQQETLASSVAESLLFKLPPELRDMVYRYALVRDRDIIVTKIRGIPEPALLSVNKLVRSETYEIFYRENHFNCVVRRDHPATLALMHRKLSGTSQLPSVKLQDLVKMTVNRKGMRCWKNLETWFHLCRQGVCLGLASTPDDSIEISLMVGIFSVTLCDPRIAPNALDVLLESVRATFVKLHKDWDRD